MAGGGSSDPITSNLYSADQTGSGVTTPGPRQAPIPGERDPSTLTHREPGAVGGQFAGADIPSPAPAGWLDDRTAREHAREGGGK